MKHGEWIQPALIIASALAGIALGMLAPSGLYAGIIVPSLAAMLLFIFLSVRLGEIKTSFSDARFTASNVIINFIWTPIFAAILGIIFFSNSADIRIGLLMLLIAPCTDWYLVFTAMAKGNVALGSSILPLNLVLQIILLPAYLMLFFGMQASFDMTSMLLSMAPLLLIPLAVALALKSAAPRIKPVDKLVSGANAKTDDLQLIFLCIAIVAMFAAEGSEIIGNWEMLLLLTVPLLIFFAVSYALPAFASKKIGMKFDDATSLIFTSMARNSPLSLAIAFAVFPNSPLICVVLAVAPLIELPVLSIATKIRLRSIEVQHESFQL